MKFVNPYLLNLLWGLIPVTAMMVYGILMRKKILSLFVSQRLLPYITPGFDLKRRWVKLCLILAASAFSIMALSGPLMGYRWEKVKQKGVDIMLALDCSKSMLAQDIKPSRLERAKREIIDLLRMMKSDRAGLVAFSGRAILQCPLTLDHEAFNIFLNVLEPGFLPVGGTNLGDAVKACMDGFEKESDTEKAIIIITDGESTTGDVEQVAKQVAEKGIKIFCIGVGGLQGAPIPDENGGFKKDGSGNIILTKVDEKGLEKIAAVTGGTYVRSVAGDMDLDVIYTDNILGGMERKTLVSGKRKVWENRYQWFLFPALVLLLIEYVLPSTRKKNQMLVLLITIGAALVVFQNNSAEAKSVSSSVKKGIKAYETQQYEKAKKHFIDAQLEKPDKAELHYNIGTAAYMNKEYEQAEKSFLEAVKSKDTQLRHNARYNLANTQFKMNNLDGAIDGYEAILKEFPDDRQTRENLEFAKRKKQEQAQQKNKEKQEKNQKQDSRNEQDPQKGHNENRDQKNENKGAGEQKPEQNKMTHQNSENNQDQDNKKDQGSLQGKQSDQTPPEPEAERDQEIKTSQAEDPVGKKPGRADNTLQRMLNRLEDKPGQAMRPVVEEHYIEKDW